MRIRDNIHGDIEIPKKFQPLVDAAEFQRLRRIRQLATANLVFPGAEHSRFTHSLGVFAIMQKIVKHFEGYLGSIGMGDVLKDKDALLAAALLHDIGHGPFSHAFEGALPQEVVVKHEDWTEKILMEPRTEIHQALEAMGPGFARMVTDYIKGSEAFKNKEPVRNSMDLTFILGSLVSSQLDADRMDFLLRDARSVGVTYGRIDIDKLINGLQISVLQDGSFCLCVQEAYLPNLEEYFYSRYQMYRNIYFHPYKLFTEELLKKIISCAYNLYRAGKLSAKYIPEGIKRVFNKSDIEVRDYCLLDDAVFMGAIHTWTELRERDLQGLGMLCRALLERKGFEKIDLKNYASGTISYFKNKLFKLIDLENNQEPVFLIKGTGKTSTYNVNSPVYIIRRDGKLQELGVCSPVLSAIISSGLSMDKEQSICSLYWSRELLEQYLKNKSVYNEIGEGVSDVVDRAKEWIERCSARKHTEIEKKYLLDTVAREEAEEIVERMVQVLTEKGYECTDEGVREQTDIYYDTPDGLLRKKGCILRIRKKKQDHFLITCKHPVESNSSGIHGQLERAEDEERTDSDQIQDNSEFIQHCFADFLKSSQLKMDDLKMAMRIVNNRRKITVRKNPEQQDMFAENYEMVFDDVTYVNPLTGKESHEFQVEIELKSQYETRVNMKIITDFLEKVVGKLRPNGQSKYERACQATAGI